MKRRVKKSRQPIQVFYIHGGMTFKNKKDYYAYLRHRKLSLEKRVRWHGEYLDKQLGKGFEVIRPRMPFFDDAKYRDWEITFQRYMTQIRPGVILIGESLGGIFLAKYLSEHKLSKKILATYLVCPPFDNSLPGEDLVGGFRLKKDLTLLEKNSPNLRLFFSKNDDVVPVAHAYKVRSKTSEYNSDYLQQ